MNKGTQCQIRKAGISAGVGRQRAHISTWPSDEASATQSNLGVTARSNHISLRRNMVDPTFKVGGVVGNAEGVLAKNKLQVSSG
jgi:hypothetical protein